MIGKLTHLGRNRIQDFVTVDNAASSHSSYDWDQFVRFPLVAQALVVVYNLPELYARDAPQMVLERWNGSSLIKGASLTSLALADQVLDRDTVARIWTGSVSTWNDPRIIALNPDLEPWLPDGPIVLGYCDNHSTENSLELFEMALESFSDDFANQFSAFNRTFGNMPPAIEGIWQPISSLNEQRARWVQVTLSKPHKEYSPSHMLPLQHQMGGMTVVNLQIAQAMRIKWSKMINQAGSLVEPTNDTVWSAIQDFTNQTEVQIPYVIIDGPGTESWPLSFISRLVMYRDLTIFDCARIRELLNFLAWTYTNDRYPFLFAW